MPEESITFKVDYPASSRSRCCLCKQAIAKGELRVGPIVKPLNGDFLYPSWHHFACFEDGWLKEHPGAFVDVYAVSGIENLSPSDQQRIESLAVRTFHP